MSTRAFQTFVDVSTTRAATSPQRRALEFIEDGDGEGLSFTYGQLDRRAREIAVALTERAKPGDRALLLYPPGLEYVAAFFGCLYAGVIAVPAYPPSPMRLARTLPRLTAIIEDCGAGVVLTTQAIAGMAPAVSAMAPGLGNLHWMATDALDVDAELWTPGTVRPTSPAFIQYTSGSTGTPKGVVLEHRHLLENSAMIQGAFELDASSRGVIWLPPYHDMGLIGGILQPIFVGFDVTLMSPLTFLKRPALWLETISRTRATCSGGPNFAYDLCIRKTTEEQRAGLDLSSWSVAFTGAEPIRSHTLAGFADAFAPAKFRRRAFYPCYGLAEATLIVSGGQKSATPIERRFDKTSLGNGRARLHEDGTRLVGCGRGRDATSISIVDASGNALSDGLVGEIWVRSPSVAHGYWGAEEASERTFGATIAGQGGRWLRTGDLGFLDSGELFVTGRAKDLIIVRGRNLYPQDLELAVEDASPVFRSGNIVAFGQLEDGEERVVVIAEVERGYQGEDQQAGRRAAVEAGVAAIVEQFEVAPHELVLVPRNSLPKTSSGKLQRSASREMYASGAFEALESSTAAEDEPHDDPAQLDELEVAMWLKQQVARIAGVPTTKVDARRGLTTAGIDSLRSVELLEAIEAEFQVRLTLESLLHAPNLVDLAGSIAAAPKATVCEDTESSTQPFGLSAGQRALWFLQQLDPDSSAYNVSKAVVIADFDAERFRAALQGLITRHAQLRTVFEQADGIPMQRALEHVGLPLTHTRRESLEGAEEEFAARAREPFVLERGPAFRVDVIESQGSAAVLFCAHHIICDFWSIALIVDELGRRFETGADPQTRAGRYRDHVDAEATYLATEADADLEAWSERLQGVRPLDLPTDRARPERRTGAGDVVELRMPREETSALRALADELHATPFAVSLSAYASLLARLSGQDDIVVGVPTSGRGRTADATTVGYFVNTVPVRVRLEPEQTFAELVRTTQAALHDAIALARLPFVRLVERLGQRPTNRSPIFDVSCTWQESHLGGASDLAALALDGSTTALDWGGTRLEGLALARSTSLFDLSLTLAAGDAGLMGALEYSTELFDRDTAESMGRAYLELLRAAIAEPESRWSSLPLPGGDSQIAANETDVEVDDTPVHLAFDAWAVAHPDDTAIVDERAHSYGEIRSLAHGVASRLRARGVGHGDVVAIDLPRSAAAVGAMLGVLYVGAGFLLLDQRQPRARLERMLDHARPTATLTTDEVWHGLEGEVVDPVQSAPEDLAYVMFTSGSTGVPKGVLIEHRALTNRIAWGQQVFPLATDDTMLQNTTFGFDVCVWEIFAALGAGCGARLAIAPDCVQTDPVALSAYMREHDVTAAGFVPSMLAELVREPSFGSCSRLRQVLSGGEALSGDLRDAFFAVHPEADLLNFYGPAEAAIDTTYFRCRPDHSSTSVPVGRPIGNVRAFVLDDSRRPVPTGVAGELYVAGANLARGYIDPTASMERFVELPLGGESFRAYRTGDLARWNGQGQLEFLGRVDAQLKIRGVRIEPAEIETVLRQHPRVRDAVVLAVERETTT